MGNINISGNVVLPIVWKHFVSEYQSISCKNYNSYHVIHWPSDCCFT